MGFKIKKYWGQHFLTNKIIAEQIANSLELKKNQNIVEIGPGTGSLTKFLIKKTNQITLIEIDSDCIEFLQEKFKDIHIIRGDFLKIDLKLLRFKKYSIIGNFPYNISSQILFKVLASRGMF